MNIDNGMVWLKRIYLAVPDEKKAEVQEIIMDKMKELADDVIDPIEDWIEDTETTLDDMTLGYLIKRFRAEFGVPDNIGGDLD